MRRPGSMPVMRRRPSQTSSMVSVPSNSSASQRRNLLVRACTRPHAADRTTVAHPPWRDSSIGHSRAARRRSSSSAASRRASWRSGGAAAMDGVPRAEGNPCRPDGTVRSPGATGSTSLVHSLREHGGRRSVVVRSPFDAARAASAARCRGTGSGRRRRGAATTTVWRRARSNGSAAASSVAAGPGIIAAQEPARAVDADEAHRHLARRSPARVPCSSVPNGPSSASRGGPSRWASASRRSRPGPRPRCPRCAARRRRPAACVAVGPASVADMHLLRLVEVEAHVQPSTTGTRRAPRSTRVEVVVGARRARRRAGRSASGSSRTRVSHGGVASILDAVGALLPASSWHYGCLVCIGARRVVGNALVGEGGGATGGAVPARAALGPGQLRRRRRTRPARRAGRPAGRCARRGRRCSVCGRIVVDDDELDLAAVTGVDRARRVDQAQAGPRRQTRARVHERGVTLGHRDGQPGAAARPARPAPGSDRPPPRCRRRHRPAARRSGAEMGQRDRGARTWTCGASALTGDEATLDRSSTAGRLPVPACSGRRCDPPHRYRETLRTPWWWYVVAVGVAACWRPSSTSPGCGSPTGSRSAPSSRSPLLLVSVDGPRQPRGHRRGTAHPRRPPALGLRQRGRRARRADAAPASVRARGRPGGVRVDPAVDRARCAGLGRRRPDDPTPYWVVSSRNPDRVVKARAGRPLGSDHDVSARGWAVRGPDRSDHRGQPRHRLAVAGQVASSTGASRGIGLAIAARMVAEGVGHITAREPRLGRRPSVGGRRRRPATPRHRHQASTTARARVRPPRRPGQQHRHQSGVRPAHRARGAPRPARSWTSTCWPHCPGRARALAAGLGRDRRRRRRQHGLGRRASRRRRASPTTG